MTTPSDDLWTGRATGPVLVVVGTLLLAAAFAVSIAAIANGELPSVVGGIVVVVASALVVLAFVTVEVTIDAAGLRARSRPVAVTRVAFTLEEIEAVRLVDHRAFSWGISGGWGYRGSLRLFRRAAWVVRSGPALELDLRGRRRFTVTVDDAAHGAELLHRLITRPG